MCNVTETKVNVLTLWMNVEIAGNPSEIGLINLEMTRSELCVITNNMLSLLAL